MTIYVYNVLKHVSDLYAEYVKAFVNIFQPFVALIEIDTILIYVKTYLSIIKLTSGFGLVKA